MTRRLFLKGLVTAGIVAAIGLPLFEEELLKLSDYPELTYQRDYIIHKNEHLHIIYFLKDNKKWYIAEYSKEEELPPGVLNSMIKKAQEAGM